MSIVFFLCIDLGLKRGFRDIKGQVIEISFGDGWKITINGKREQIGNLPYCHVLVERNGWPVTILGPSGGGPILGVPEDELIQALKDAGAELPPDEPPAPDTQQALPFPKVGS
jgi:hypothetical protein